jgi:hypothetical protein
VVTGELQNARTLHFLDGLLPIERKATFFTAVPRHPPEAEYSLRAFLVFCEVAFDSLHWFSHQNLLRQKEILGLPQKVLSEVQRRRLGI